MKKRKIGINSSLEFKFFSIEISFDVLKIMYPAGIFFVCWGKKENEGKGGDVFFLRHLNFHTQEHFSSVTVMWVLANVWRILHGSSETEFFTQQETSIALLDHYQPDVSFPGLV